MRKNAFKAALSASAPQLGLWLSLCSAASAEISAGSGADWLLIDMEHSPNEIASVADQLRAAENRTSVLVRPPVSDQVVTKRLLDIGVQSIMFPMIDTAEQAAAVVAWTRYPPHGSRGYSGVMRGNDYGRDTGYRDEVQTQTCVIVQAETPLALRNIEAIAAVPGVDAIFIGPGDLAAAMGHAGAPWAAPVRGAITDGLQRITAAGCHAGVLAYGAAAAAEARAQGAGFIAVGADTWLLARETTALVASCRKASTV
ncbi:MAG: hypothetical protein IAE87_17600 [Rhodobacteraceae bacterium]|jgi:4-hydroxy-2-oxoheptanedioate aldolase|nr:hypothetical protein [Paracoccaceae bacterium]